MRYRFIIIQWIFFLCICFQFQGWSQSIVNSLHNLSVSGPGGLKSSSESEICVFCHTPHNSLPSSPLWNKDDPGYTYTLYHSSTIQAAPGQPDGTSILCLSCHDGTTALGSVLSRTGDIPFTGGITSLPQGASNLSTDLANDHPISFDYTTSLSAADGQLKDPASVHSSISLRNGRMQCTSCHDPHRNLTDMFLVVTRQFSELCNSCHDRDYWDGSSHRNSTATWNGNGADPWPHTGFPNVAENGCENCHNPHHAGNNQRLMNYQAEENNCLACHNGNVASTNLLAQLTKPYLHNVYGYNLDHDAGEGTLLLSMHVECEDCHNPHAVRSTPATAPGAPGSLAGVRGIDQGGNPVDPLQYEYELCYRCHADSPSKPASRTTRQIEQNNVRLEFDPANPSHHAVYSAGPNPNVPSLISPLTETSIIYCTGCHGSDGPGAPRGPHGSVYQGQLRLRYLTDDRTSESPSAYELCYQCHDRNSILNDESFDDHEKHIRELQTPCNACHDPHGISHTQGTSVNHAHLINFDLNIVSPANNGTLRYESTGLFSGRCYLKCHGQNHMGWHYGY
jgi:predicted CXXCH cytochrome family protein